MGGGPDKEAEEKIKAAGGAAEGKSIYIRTLPDGTREYDNGGRVDYIGPLKSDGKEASPEQKKQFTDWLERGAKWVKEHPDNPEDIRKVQQFLKDKIGPDGKPYYKGPANGKMDIDSAVALALYKDIVGMDHHGKDAQGNYTLNPTEEDKHAGVKQDGPPEVAAAIARMDANQDMANRYATEHSHEQKASTNKKSDTVTADVETIQGDLEKRNLYHYKVDGDFGPRSNRGLEKMIVQAQIEGQKKHSYTGKVNGEYNGATRAAMEHMGVSAETLTALDRLQSTHELQALYHPSGNAMMYKTASLAPGFHESASGTAAPTQQATAPPQQPAAGSRPPRPA